jgi:hypothetical protein
MKNNLFENDKIKFSLINRLKINRKSIQLLKPLNIIQNNEEDKLSTSRNDESTKNALNKNYNLKSNLFAKKFKDMKVLKNDSESENSISNRYLVEKSKIMPLLSDRYNTSKIKKQIKLKFPLNSIKNKKKPPERNNDDLNIDANSPFNTFDQSSNRIYTKNLDKYKKIFNSVSSRIKTYCDKSKHLSNSKIFVFKNYSSKNLVNTLQSPNKRKSSLRTTNKMILTQSSAKKPQLTIEDYTKTLNKEFNTQELINIENRKIKERLKNFKVKVYDKTPLFDTTEKLNMYLGREFNLDITNLKKSFNKKYKVYTNSINKIKEIKHKNLFSNNNVFGFKINLDKNDYGENGEMYNLKSQFSDIDSKGALKTFYNNKAKDKLSKKLELEKELIELENKFAYIIEQEKTEKNRMGINYGEINQVIQKKFLVREIYELDRNQKKKQFYDEQTKILYKTRNYLPTKVLKDMLKQKTINKFKEITGVHFG